MFPGQSWTGGSSSPASESMHHHHHHQGYSTLFGKHGTPLAAVHGLQGGAGAPFFSLLSQKSPHSSVKCESFAFFQVKAGNFSFPDAATTPIAVSWD